MKVKNPVSQNIYNIYIWAEVESNELHLLALL